MIRYSIPSIMITESIVFFRNSEVMYTTLFNSWGESAYGVVPRRICIFFD